MLEATDARRTPSFDGELPLLVVDMSAGLGMPPGGVPMQGAPASDGDESARVDKGSVRGGERASAPFGPVTSCACHPFGPCMSEYSTCKVQSVS